MLKNDRITLAGMHQVVESARAELNKLYARRDKRDATLRETETEESKKKWKPEFIFQRQMEARSRARDDSKAGFDEITSLLKPLVGEPARWTKKSILARARFAPKPKTVTEYASNKETLDLHNTLLEVLDTQRRLFWALTLPGMSGEELVSTAGEAVSEGNLALLHATQREHTRRPVKADDVQQGKQKAQMMEMVDSLELDEEKQATVIFEEVEKLGREANFLFDDLNATDSLASKQAARIMSDDELIKQFHQQNQ
jgi:hypothetical protein